MMMMKVLMMMMMMKRQYGTDGVIKFYMMIILYANTVTVYS
jgi:hypothetical protein